MKLSLKHYGQSKIGSSIIELTVESNGNTIVEDVVNSKGLVSETLIQDLRNIADELEEQNKIVNEAII